MVISVAVHSYGVAPLMLRHQVVYGSYLSCSLVLLLCE